MTIIEEMKKNITKEEKTDGITQYSVSYCTEYPLESVFTPEVSNYNTALTQAKHIFSKFMATPAGREAVHTMVQRGKDDKHFRFLTKQEATQVLKQPHNFVSQTVSIFDNQNKTCLQPQLSQQRGRIQH